MSDQIFKVWYKNDVKHKEVKCIEVTSDDPIVAIRMVKEIINNKKMFIVDIKLKEIEMPAKKLYIFHNTDEGVICDQVEIDNFSDWFEKQTKDIKVEYHPIFVDKMPEYNSPRNLYFIIHGEFVMPEPVKTVIEYKLPFMA